MKKKIRVDDAVRSNRNRTWN